MSIQRSEEAVMLLLPIPDGKVWVLPTHWTRDCPNLVASNVHAPPPVRSTTGMAAESRKAATSVVVMPA
jgi:hypothetical protein